MKRHISYPKIKQFRDVVSSINREVEYIGQDSYGEPVYSKYVKKPTLLFKGTVKLHGTNSSVCFNAKDGYWVQSRNNIITLEKDNAGFAKFACNHENEFMQIIFNVANENNLDLHKETVTVFGEWVGKGIQKGVAIAELEKSFFIFGIKISPIDNESFTSYWLNEDNYMSEHVKIYNINNYGVYHKEIDFNNPSLSQNELASITEDVEKQCPVAKAFNIEGIGEGVVWRTFYNGNLHTFKVKGEKHSVTKVKKLASVDTEKLNSINEFVEYAVTENRFNQAVKEVFGNEDPYIEKMGDLIRWVVNDIHSEESDTLKDNNLEPKDVNKNISLKVREMFFNL